MLKRESRAFYGEKSPVRAAAASAGKEDKNMAKGKTTVYFCQECGYESAKWMGQCPACHEWNSFVEETVEKKSVGAAVRIAAVRQRQFPCHRLR